MSHHHHIPSKYQQIEYLNDSLFEILEANFGVEGGVGVGGGVQGWKNNYQSTMPTE